MHREPKDVRLVTVDVIYGMLRANVIRGLLESSGIPVMLRYEAAGPAIGLVIDGFGRVEVQVPADWEQEARDLLAAELSSDATDTSGGDATGDDAAMDDAFARDEADAPGADDSDETWDEIAAGAEADG